MFKAREKNESEPDFFQKVWNNKYFLPTSREV